jgi:hypothetical protein
VSERRLQAIVIGPGAPGFLKILFGRGDATYVRDVAVERIPPSIRHPNSSFVAVVVGGDLVRVEAAGQDWIEIQDRIRAVLNSAWDPIGVADAVDDEYNSYIAGIYSLVQGGASVVTIAEHLGSIEVETIGLRGSPMNKLLAVAAKLCQLQLPALAEPGPRA